MQERTHSHLHVAIPPSLAAGLRRATFSSHPGVTACPICAAGA